eukprot:352281_1
MEANTVDPFRPTGKRHYISADEHKQWNFLHHYPHKNTKISFKDEPNINKSRFGKGFKRKPLDTIWPNKEKNRIKQWENATKRRILHENKRKEFLTSKNNINGNLLTSDIPKQNERELFQTKRKVTFNDKMSIRDRCIRDKVSKNRFYHPELSKRPQIRKIKPNMKHFSSDIKIGKNDIKSNGTLDNFIGHGY